MKETFDKIMIWVKSNMWLSIGIALVGVLLFFPKLLSSPRRRRRRSTLRTPAARRRRVTRMAPPRRRTKRTYSKGGRTKKPWQIKGSLAAKRYMAKIRKRR